MGSLHWWQIQLGDNRLQYCPRQLVQLLFLHCLGWRRRIGGEAGEEGCALTAKWRSSQGSWELAPEDLLQMWGKDEEEQAGGANQEIGLCQDEGSTHPWKIGKWHTPNAFYIYVYVGVKMLDFHLCYTPSLPLLPPPHSFHLLQPTQAHCQEAPTLPPHTPTSTILPLHTQLLLHPQVHQYSQLMIQILTSTTLCQCSKFVPKTWWSDGFIPFSLPLYYCCHWNMAFSWAWWLK